MNQQIGRIRGREARYIPVLLVQLKHRITDRYLGGCLTLGLLHVDVVESEQQVMTRVEVCRKVDLDLVVELRLFRVIRDPRGGGWLELHGTSARVQCDEPAVVD